MFCRLDLEGDGVVPTCVCDEHYSGSHMVVMSAGGSHSLAVGENYTLGNAVFPSVSLPSGTTVRDDTGMQRKPAPTIVAPHLVKRLVSCLAFAFRNSICWCLPWAQVGQH